MAAGTYRLALILSVGISPAPNRMIHIHLLLRESLLANCKSGRSRALSRPTSANECRLRAS